MSDRLANQAWEALMTAHARLLRQFAADDWEDLSMREYDVLYTLAKRGPSRIGELGESVLLSRATDEAGYVQPTRRALIAERGLGTDYHFNQIVGWKVAGDGTVTFHGET